MAKGATSDSIKAYESIIQAFTAKTRHEIEILPVGISPPPGSLILLDEECIGIPKPVLVQAFLFARASFMAKVRTGNTRDNVS
jgi:hypothetical protein